MVATLLNKNQLEKDINNDVKEITQQLLVATLEPSSACIQSLFNQIDKIVIDENTEAIINQNINH